MRVFDAAEVSSDISDSCSFEVPDLPIEDVRRLIDLTYEEAEESLNKMVADFQPRIVTPQDSEFDDYAALLLLISRRPVKSEGSVADQQQYRDLVNDCVSKGDASPSPTPALTSLGQLCEIDENGVTVSGDHGDFDVHARERLNSILKNYSAATTPTPQDQQMVDYLRDCLGEQ